MAATAVYAAVTRIPTSRGDSEQNQNASFSNIGATTAAFFLSGGMYCFAVKASTYGSVTLQMLLPDGATWATAPLNFSGEVLALVADGAANINLQPGTYRVAVA
jgi:hypothetical protein